MALIDDLNFFQFLKTEGGYVDPRPTGDGRWIALFKFIFTHAIVTGNMGDFDGYEDRWCYHDAASARAAFDAWDGHGEPLGWHRHPTSGRRRENGVDIGVW